MKTVIPILFFLVASMISLGQKSRLPHQAKADSLVSHFLGKEIFERYVTHDPIGLDVQFRNYPENKNAKYVDYDLQHPKFSGKKLVIAFMIDSLGELISTAPVVGLIRIDSLNDSNWISRDQALNICKNQSFRLKKKSLRLTWNSTNVSFDTYIKTHDFRDIIPGALVWEVNGEVKFRGERYKGTFQVNVFTGAVSRLFAIPWD